MSLIDNGQALFNLQRFEILKTKLDPNPKISDLIPDAYAYAWCEKVYPFGTESDLHEGVKPYFRVTEEFGESIFRWAEKEQNQGNYHGFLKYLLQFGGEEKKRELILFFRYAWLAGYFNFEDDGQFWKELLIHHPSVTTGMMDEFNINEIRLL